MYRITISFFLITNCLISDAQTMHLNPNSQWTIGYYSGSTFLFYNILFIPDSDFDTLIGPQNYYKTYLYNGGGINYFGGVRNDSTFQKVYYIPNDSLNEYIAFDFSADVGDTIFNVVTFYGGIPLNFSNYKVTAKGSTYLNYDVIYSSEGHTNGPSYWNSDVGSQHGFLFDESTAVSGYTMLECMKINDTVKFSLYPWSCDYPLGLAEEIPENTDIIIIQNEMIQIKGIAENSLFRISDISGRIISTGSIRGSGSVPISGLNNGLYNFVIYNEKGKMASKKFGIVK